MIAKEVSTTPSDVVNEESRTRRLELLGRALALKPDHEGALADFVELLAAPVRTVPDEVAEELRVVEAEQVRSAGRLGAFVFLGLNLFTLWLAFIANFTAWFDVLPFVVCTTVTGLVSYLVSLLKKPGPQHSYVVFVLSILTTVSLVTFFGVFLVVPSMLAVMTMAFALNTPARWGWRVIATGGGAVVALSLLPFLDVIPSGVSSEAGVFMLAVPLKVQSVEEVQLFVTVASCAVVMLAGVVILPIRRRLDVAQRRSRTMTWQLRHLIPAQIRFMGDVASSSVMKASDLVGELAEKDSSDRQTRRAGVSGAYPSKSLSTRRLPESE